MWRRTVKEKCSLLEKKNADVHSGKPTAMILGNGDAMFTSEMKTSTIDIGLHRPLKNCQMVWTSLFGSLSTKMRPKGKKNGAVDQQECHPASEREKGRRRKR